MFSFLLMFALSTQPLLEGNPVDKARSVLQDGFSDKSSDKRVHAVHALSGMGDDSKAKTMVESAFADGNADVRAEAAIAVGEMKDSAAIPKLKEALKDKEIRVVVAAANALVCIKRSSRLSGLLCAVDRSTQEQRWPCAIATRHAERPQASGKVGV